MTTPTHTTNIKDDYAQQIANDLTANHTAQQHTRDELHRLQQELQQLEESAKVLLKMQQALGIPTPDAITQTAKPATKHTAVPTPRNATRSTKKTSEPKTTPTPTATATTPTAAAPAATSPAAAEVKTPRTTKTDKAKKETSSVPSWLELITTTLTGKTEPQSAAEITHTINTTHPERKAQAAVIRNTLEQGVARGLLERTKQGRSVYYTPTTHTRQQHP
ncbi:hypothetical protein PV721_41390 [Streptomyces sp. MB09-01]|uniref:hypothetical protein n=1 Tax=Streptomyces sp. MB09-01 TaxID=3028666 RepID=UPI0029BEE14F|nr:hypothetical protein [Streptomyces sp. MB09-01]MDX3540642.1 hypothetical protein [Streptomyces sp. MB09-01]